MVQRYIAQDANNEKDRTRKVEYITPLKGLVFCGHCGSPMTVAGTAKNGRRYNYYRCSKDAKRATSTCPIRQVAASELEKVVFAKLTSILHTPMMLARIEGTTDIEGSLLTEFITDEFWQEATTQEKRRICELLIQRVVLYEDKVELEIKAEGIRAFKEQIDHEN